MHLKDIFTKRIKVDILYVYMILTTKIISYAIIHKTLYCAQHLHFELAFNVINISTSVMLDK